MKLIQISNQKRTYCFFVMVIMNLVFLHIDSVPCFGFQHLGDQKDMNATFPEGLHEDVDQQIHGYLEK